MSVDYDCGYRADAKRVGATRDPAVGHIENHSLAIVTGNPLDQFYRVSTKGTSRAEDLDTFHRHRFSPLEGRFLAPKGLSVLELSIQ